ncbi:site-2 protease family protein [Erythrobacter insulae]|uniref:Site-2 protease family protein n=1 Tax=Erythrobacter insulae TaxID=2584124 RepID=A0A547PDD4_9SPHN|nr:site-2 protease family protein [Erythrobacter insulae]TRD12064.1 site-2 protease family protein [Erythrobacter insulae]
MSETIILALVLIPCLVVAIVFHEVAHGYAAKLLGDTTASRLGRLTLNPIPHVDPVGTLLVPGFLALFGGPVFGWAKPVPVNKHLLNNPRYGMMAVAAAGPASNFVIALVAAILFGLFAPEAARFGVEEGYSMLIVDEGGDIRPLTSMLYYSILMNVFLGLFNLLPIPPFDGSHIVGGLLPASMRAQWEKLQQVGMFLFIGLIAASWAFGTGWIAQIVMPPVAWTVDQYLTIAQMISGI